MQIPVTFRQLCVCDRFRSSLRGWLTCESRRPSVIFRHDLVAVVITLVSEASTRWWLY
jgi:hypothetical protein